MTPSLTTDSTNSLSASRPLPPLPKMSSAASPSGSTTPPDPMQGLVSMLSPIQMEVTNMLTSVKKLAQLLPMYAPQFDELVSAITNILPMAAQQMMGPGGGGAGAAAAAPQPNPGGPGGGMPP